MVNTTHPWGRYALKSEEEPISGKVIYIFTTDIHYSDSNQDPFAQGFSFQIGVR